MIKGISFLKKQNIKIKKSAIICATDKVSMLEENTLVIPIWAI